MKTRNIGVTNMTKQIKIQLRKKNEILKIVLSNRAAIENRTGRKIVENKR